MERKTPRYDYIAPGKHTRDAFRGGPWSSVSEGQAQAEA